MCFGNLSKQPTMLLMVRKKALLNTNFELRVHCTMLNCWVKPFATSCKGVLLNLEVIP